MKWCLKNVKKSKYKFTYDVHQRNAKHGRSTLIVWFDNKRVLILSNYLGMKNLLPNENRWVGRKKNIPHPQPACIFILQG